MEANHIYLLMKSEYRISRNIRASWVFKNLNNVIEFTPVLNPYEFEEELSILSIEPTNQEIRLATGKKYLFLITPTTNVTFLARRYRLVFTLDISPSLATVNPCSGDIVLNESFKILSECLRALVQPIRFPGTDTTYLPEIYVTILVHTTVNININRVFIQGFLISEENVETLLSDVYKKLIEFESYLADCYQQMVLGNKSSDINRYEELNISDRIVNPEANFINLLRSGLLSLQLLPENSSAGLIVITDGLIGIPDATLFESLMIQLRNATIPCSFFHVGNRMDITSPLGFLTHNELIEFISMATFGACFSYTPSESQSQTVEKYHKGLLFWNFKNNADLFTDTGFTKDLAVVKRPWHVNVHDELSLSPTIVKKHSESRLKADILSVLSVRLREGYAVGDIHCTPEAGCVTIKLNKPWRNFVFIEYEITGDWPLKSNGETGVVVKIHGSYEFLHDMTCTPKTLSQSPYRLAVIKKFWHTLQGITETDQFLEHIESFNQQPVVYTLPESVKNGAPLFTVPVNDNEKIPSLSMQLNHKDIHLKDFAAFWKPIIMLDVNVWQKWFHIHRIFLILTHDRVLPKYLYIPNSNGRHHNVQCQQAFTHLLSFLQEWSSFVLMENHSYIKFLFSQNNKTPSQFYILRVTPRPPCVILHLAFVAGTPGFTRNQIVYQLKESLSNTKLNKKTIADKDSVSVVSSENTKSSRMPLTHPADMILFSVISKPVERTLIRYDQVPCDPLCIGGMNYLPYNHDELIPRKQLSNMFSLLSHFLVHNRWVWRMPFPDVVQIPLVAMGNILSTLARIRLQDGFHFAYSNRGVINMAKELTIEVDNGDGMARTTSCIAQYILFPPHLNNKSGSNNVDGSEDEGELQLMTETWIEPQYGNVVDSSFNHLENGDRSFADIPRQIAAFDWKCVNCLANFEIIKLLCQQKTPDDSNLDTPRLREENCGSDNIKVNNVYFNVVSLLPFCQQNELHFSAFVDDDSGCTKSNEALVEKFNYNLKSKNDYQINISQSLCQSFNISVRDRKSAIFNKKDQNSIDNEISIEDEAKLDISWNCYAKLENDKHIILTFIPKSYIDLQKLPINQITNRQRTTQGGNGIDISEVVHSNLSNVDDKIFKSSCDTSETVLPIIDIIGSAEGQTEVGDINFEDSEKQTNWNLQPSEPEKFDENPNEAKLEFAAEIESLSKDLSQNLSYQTSNATPKPLISEKKEGITLPVFAYSISLSDIVNSFADRDNFKMADDCFEDLKLSSTDSGNIPLCIETIEVNIEAHEELRQKSTSLDRRSNDSITETAASLTESVTNPILELYIDSYCTEVYNSLQLGHPLHQFDIDTTVVKICEESAPFELDMTEYLRRTCGHLATARGNCEIVSSDIAENSCGVEFGAISSDLSNENPCSKLYFQPTTLSIPPPPPSAIFNILDAAKNSNCELYPGLHQSIRNKFLKVLSGCHFKPAPSLPDYYFYKPDFPAANQSIYSENSDFEDKLRHNSQLSIDDDLDTDDDQNFENANDLLKSSLDIDGDYLLRDNPLFICFTCSIKINLQHHYHVSCRFLPTCFCELIQLASSGQTDIDISCVKITFDLFCLSHVSNNEKDDTFYEEKRVRFNSGKSENDPDGDCIDNAEPELSRQQMLKHLNYLTPQQKGSIKLCLQEIEWLMMDEVISALPKTDPITLEALRTVTRHISSSSNKCCRVITLDLQFVCGSNQSMPMFLKDIENLSLSGYHICCVNDHNYLLCEDNCLSKHLNSDLNKVCSSRSIKYNKGRSPKVPRNIKKDGKSIVNVQSDFELNQQAKTPFVDYSLDGILSEENQHNPAVVESNFEGLITDLELSEEIEKAHQNSCLKLDDVYKEIARSREKIKSGGSINESGGQMNDSIRLLVKRHSDGKVTDDVDNLKQLFSSNRTSLYESKSAENLPSSHKTHMLADDFGLTSKKISPKSLGAVMKIGGEDRQRNLSGISAPDTSLSLISTLPHTPSSKGSFTEEGYDGGSESDFEESINCPNDFWLIIEILHDKVNIYFHTRTNDELDMSHKHCDLLDIVKRKIQKLSDVVNQKLLLDELHKTRMCDQLLVPEADEDVMWMKDTSTQKSHEQAENEEEEEVFHQKEGQKYFFSSLEPGYFACDCVWDMDFVIHPRIKTAQSGVQLLEKKVLIYFSVQNRKNMFVFKEQSTGAIFYLKLQEKQTFAHSPGKHLNVESSPSLTSISEDRRAPEAASVTTDYDQVSLNSLTTPKSSGPSACYPAVVNLSVFGVCKPGSEICNELKQALQKQLDTTVLDLLSGFLYRNQNTKLTQHDVHFIQAPQSQPRCTLSLEVPSHFNIHISPLLSYLDQNLRTWLLPPKYADDIDECKFGDFVHGTWQPLSDTRVFLFNSPGHRGLVCISVSLVDELGCPRNLIGGPQPETDGYSLLTSSVDFHQLIEAKTFTPPPTGSRPGLTSVIQFHLWDRGQVDMDNLLQRLRASVQHSFCDIITEYHLLTAPICKVPRDEILVEQISVPQSAPTSPRRESDFKFASNLKDLWKSPVKQSYSTPTSTQVSKDTKRPKSAFSKESFDFSGATKLNKNSVINGSNLYSMTMSTSQDLSVQRQRYESGEIGSLHPVFINFCSKWLNFASCHGCPSIFKKEYLLTANFSVGIVLEEFQRYLRTEMLMDQFYIFQLDKTETANRYHSEARRSSNASVNEFQKMKKKHTDIRYVLIGRNYESWQSVFIEKYCGSMPTSGRSNIQKFSMNWPKEAIERRASLSQESLECIPDLLPIPRQHLLFLDVAGCKMCLYLYNYHQTSKVQTYFSDLLEWHNSRSLVLHSHVFQKLGLFHHAYVTTRSISVRDDDHSKADFDESIFMRTVPYRKDGRRHKHQSHSSQSEPLSQHCLNYLTFRNLKPAADVLVNTNCKETDPVMRSLKQTESLREKHIEDVQKTYKLKRLFVGWNRRPVPQIPISEDYLKELKHSSRLLHYCATPLIFCPDWRNNAIGISNQLARLSVAKDCKSVHSSTESPRVHSESLSEKEAASPHHSTHLPVVENEWHIKLREHFITKYLQYLSTLQFVPVKTRQANLKDGHKKQMSDGVSEDMFDHMIHYMQKTSAEGIILIEIYFQHGHFCVKLYGLLFCMQSVASFINCQRFVEDCDKYRDLIHVHSFSYDFHLRVIQSYIEDDTLFLTPGYHLLNFFESFLKLYSHPPSFACNYIYKDIKSFPGISTSNVQLFNFMLNHANIFRMKALTFNSSEKEEKSEQTSFSSQTQSSRSSLKQPLSYEEKALVTSDDLCHEADQSSNNYRTSLIIGLDTQIRKPEDSKNVIHLKFYVIISSLRDSFPRLNLENYLGELSALFLKRLPADSSDSSIVICDSPPSAETRESLESNPVDDFDRSQSDQSHLHKLLSMSVKAAREKISEMVAKSLVQCRRDTLWHRLYKSPVSGSSSLSFEDFKELLGLVQILSLATMDPLLAPLVNLNCQSCQGLFDVLSNKYLDSHCIFMCPQKLERYIVVFDTDLTDMFMIFGTIQPASSLILAAVYREIVSDSENTIEFHFIESFINACGFFLWSKMLI